MCFCTLLAKTGYGVLAKIDIFTFSVCFLYRTHVFAVCFGMQKYDTRERRRRKQWGRGRMVYRETNYLYSDSISGNRRNRKTPRWRTAQLTNNKNILTKRRVMAGLFVVNNYRQLDNNFLFSLFGSFNGQQLSTIWQQLSIVAERGTVILFCHQLALNAANRGTIDNGHISCRMPARQKTAFGNLIICFILTHVVIKVKAIRHLCWNTNHNHCAFEINLLWQGKNSTLVRHLKHQRITGK